MSETQVHGQCDERFSAVQDALTRVVESGQEHGASLALSVDGEVIVDLWGGSASRDGTSLWEEDTIAPVMSCSKVVCILCALILIDQDKLALDEPVATWWPDFSANGKENVTVRHILSHSSGLAGWDTPPTWELLYDWDRAVAELAAQKPWWEPGTQSGYHVYTYGYLVGELVRRTAGMTLPAFFQSEVASKLDIDFQIGVKPEDLDRVSGIVFDASAREGDHFPSAINEKISGSLNDSFARLMADPEWLQAIVPATNGVGNARSLAKVASIFANSGAVGGHRFLSPELVSEAGKEQIYTEDYVAGMPMRMGLGFGLTSEEMPIPFPDSMHWGGYGGSFIMIVPSLRAAFAFVPNKFYGGYTQDARSEDVSMALMMSLMETSQ